MKITALLDALNSALAEPFALAWSQDSPRVLLVFTVIYAVVVIVAVTDQKNTRPGAEHGSAAWGDVFRLNKFYMDRHGSNLLLTQHFHIGIDGYKHMACYYHYCALLRKAYHGKSTKRCYFLLREDFLLFSRYQQQTKFLWENHIETMDELLAYKENAEVQIQQLARQRKVLYRQKLEPERAAREEKIKSLTQQMKALRHEVYICSDIETDAAEVQEKLRQAELAAQEERNEVKQDEQRRRSSRSDGAGSLTGYRSSH